MKDGNVKKVKVAEISEIMVESLNNNNKVILTVSGSSMFPFLLDGIDQVVIEKKTNLLKAGDIILYNKNNFIIHRIMKKKKHYYIVAGDALLIKEKVFEEDILGCITEIIKKDRTIIVKSDRRYRCREKLWRRLFFCRRLLLFVLRRFKNKKHFI